MTKTSFAETCNGSRRRSRTKFGRFRDSGSGRIDAGASRHPLPGLSRRRGLKVSAISRGNPAFFVVDRARCVAELILIEAVDEVGRVKKS